MLISLARSEPTRNARQLAGRAGEAARAAAGEPAREVGHPPGDRRAGAGADLDRLGPVGRGQHQVDLLRPLRPPSAARRRATRPKCPAGSRGTSRHCPDRRHGPRPRGCASMPSPGRARRPSSVRTSASHCSSVRSRHSTFRWTSAWWNRLRSARDGRVEPSSISASRCLGRGVHRHLDPGAGPFDEPAQRPGVVADMGDEVRLRPARHQRRRIELLVGELVELAGEIGGAAARPAAAPVPAPRGDRSGARPSRSLQRARAARLRARRTSTSRRSPRRLPWPRPGTRAKCRRSMIGASEKRKRSNWLSARSDHGTQDGTTNRSPISSVCSAPSEDDRALALEDLEDGRADLAPGGRGGAGAQPVELGPDRRHHVAAGGRVDVADRRRGPARPWPGGPRPRAAAARSGRGRCAPSGRRRSASSTVSCRPDSGRRPGWHHSRSAREKFGVASSVTRSAPNSKKPTSFW